METIDNTATSEPTRKMKNCLECGNSFPYTLETAQYCSNVCRAKANKKKMKTQPELFPQNAAAASQSVPPANAALGSLQQLYFIPPHAQTMIEHYKNEATRWENNFNKEVNRRETIEKELKDLHLERDKEKNHPGGLQGFVDKHQDLAMELVRQFGPVLAGAMQNKMNGGVAGQIAGPGALGVSEQAVAFNNWMASLSPATQESVWTLLTLFMQQPDGQVNDFVSGILMRLSNARTGS